MPDCKVGFFVVWDATGIIPNLQYDSETPNRAKSHVHDTKCGIIIFVDFEAGNERILRLILGEGKEYARMDRELLTRLERVLNLLETVKSLDSLRSFRSLDLKFFDGHYQVRVDGEKRLWFETNGDRIVIVHFGSTDHKHGRIR